ncbi:MAG TPA: tetratricopeptide repeat protein [Thermoanaerobaculia bacterium]|jgi:predicted negative regulator of RcsB-dependent stress response
MDRQQRHNLRHDKFVDEIGHLSTRARANQRVLAMIAGAAVLIAAIVYGIYFYRTTRERTAQEALAAAIDTVDAPIDQPGQPPKATGPHFKTADERTAAAERLFRDVQAKYSGTDASDVAGIYIARIAVTKGDTATARKNLEQFVGEHKDHLLVGAARYSLYLLRIDGGEAPQVTTELNAELAKAEPSLPGDSLLSLLAHAYEVQGNTAKSRETYRRIATEFPDSPYAVEAQRRAGIAGA